MSALLARETPEPSSALTHRCCDSLIEGFRRLAWLTEGGSVEEQDGTLLIATGMPMAPFNPAFVTRLPDDVFGALEHAKLFYAARDLPWELVATDEMAATLGPFATARGFAETSTVPGMMLAPLAGQPKLLGELSVRVVDDFATLKLYNNVAALGFEAPRAMFAKLDNPALLDARGLTMYLGFVDGLPVTTAMTYYIDGVALVFNICTIPAYRRRGLGEAMTWQAAFAGMNDGCDVSFLQASRMGMPLYERMGYRHVVNFHTWQLRGPA